MKVLSFGEIIWDVYPDKSCIGGAPLNFAAHVAKLGKQSYLLSCVGDDSLGKKATEHLAKFGVDDSFVGMAQNKQTGICNVALDVNGVPTYTIVDDMAYDYITETDQLFDTKFDLFAFGTLALRHKNNRDVVKKILKTVNIDKIYCDLNLRAPFFDGEGIDFCLAKADVVKVSDNEVKFVSRQVFGQEVTSPRQFVKRLAQVCKNLEVVLLTCGEQGSYAYDKKSDEVYFCPATKAEVVSTVGAGDSFGAAFVSNMLDGKDIQSCMQKGAELSAYVVSHAEAVHIEKINKFTKQTKIKDRFSPVFIF